MLGLGELKKTKVYQEAQEEGRLEGIEQGKLQTKLEMVPLLLKFGLSVQEVAQRLQLDVEAVSAAAEN